MFECQYCGKDGNIPRLRRGVALTLDHVIPKCQGGGRGWENMVASCQKCNTRKGGRTPKEARMPLINNPHAPQVRELWEKSLQLDPTGYFPQKWLAYLDLEGE